MLSSHTVGFQWPDNSNLANLTPGLCRSSWSWVWAWAMLPTCNNVYYFVRGLYSSERGLEVHGGGSVRLCWLVRTMSHCQASQ